ALFGGLGRGGAGGGDGATDGLVPIAFVGFPAESYAGAAIFITGLEDEIFTLGADEGEEIDVLAVVRGAGVLDDAGPGNVAMNEIALAMGEQRAVAFVGEDSE